jgi:7-cyano-7-deazaguanine synthase
VTTDRALVLFSGGQDSTTCLAWALERFSNVETIGFDYGQRHSVELECRDRIRARLGTEFPAWRSRLQDDHLLRIPVLAEISDTALTSQAAIMVAASGLPNTFVPGRNLLFLTLAAAVAYRRGLSVMVGGMCETDFSGYPDCRDNALKAMTLALCLGMDAKFRLETPLMWLDKVAIWRLADCLGGKALVELVRTDTHTCYLGVREHQHSWGFGCGSCPACQLRANGYQRWAEST